MSATSECTLFLLGTSHQVANLNERESIGLPPDSLEIFYRGLEDLPGLEECLVLNTCNRTEIYGAANQSFEIDRLVEYLANFRQLSDDFIKQKTYLRTGKEMVRHLFEVASGIDSQMVGETEILGQLKKAYDDASERNSTGKLLNRLFQKSFQAAKWARTNTGISRGQVNLGNVLCELARRIFGRIDQCRLLVVGAGEVAESALEAFKSRGSEAITVTGRTFDWCPLSRRKPDELAQKFDGFTLAYSKFHESLHLFDVVLASTASAKALLTKIEVENAMKKRPSKPLFLIDASVPRNVEDTASMVDNVFLYNMDDVSTIANENLQSRLSEVDRCRVALSKRAIRLWEQIQAHPSLPS
ncbi:MAG: glutamyl-tRNA reductase [Opitutae bacterium]